MRKWISRIFVADSTYSVGEKVATITWLLFPTTAAAIVGWLAASAANFLENFGWLGVAAAVLVAFFFVCASLALYADWARYRLARSAPVSLVTPKPKSPADPLDASDPRGGLALGFIPHNNQHYKNQTIVLDGHAYTDCTFENCTFSYNGGLHAVINCRITGGPPQLTTSSKIVGSTLRVMGMLYPVIRTRFDRDPKDAPP